jgi:hypothetical protein
VLPSCFSACFVERGDEMVRSRQRLGLIGALVAGMLALASCGGTKGVVVARVGHTAITREAVSHWMKVLVAGDFRSELVKVAPSGLVSDPPNYQGCMRAADEVGVKRSRQLTDRLCRELYHAVRLQAVALLVDAATRAEDAAEHEEKVTSAEVASSLRSYREASFPAPGSFQAFLRERHLSVSDEAFLLKRNLLEVKLRKRAERHDIKSIGAGERFTEEYSAKWTAQTTCQPGYVVEACSEFKGASGPSPNEILLKLAGQES